MQNDLLQAKTAIGLFLVRTLANLCSRFLLSFFLGVCLLFSCYFYFASLSALRFVFSANVRHLRMPDAEQHPSAECLDDLV